MHKVNKRRGYDDSDSVAANIGERRSQMRSRSSSIDSAYSYTGYINDYNYKTNGTKTNNKNNSINTQNNVGHLNYPPTLNYLDIDKHIGKEVCILVGRLSGQVGVVVGNTNGWIQLRTNGEIFAKRANELSLDLEKSLEYLEAVNGMYGHSNGDSSGFVYDSNGNIIVNTHVSNNENNSDNYGQGYNTSTGTTMRTLKIAMKRKRLESHYTHAKDIRFEDSCDDKDKDCSRKINEFDSSSAGDNTTLTGNILPPQFPSYGAYSGGEMKGISEEADKKHKGPLVHPYFIQQKRAFVQRYADRLKCAVNGRPNLRLHRDLINGSNMFVDREYELKAARDFDTSFCKCCLIEKWSRSCWNENCPLSPIYFRLPGAAGEPQVTLNYIESIREMQLRELQEKYEQKDKGLNTDDGDNKVVDIMTLVKQQIQPWYQQREPPAYIQNPVFRYLQIDHSIDAKSQFKGCSSSLINEKEKNELKLQYPSQFVSDESKMNSNVRIQVESEVGTIVGTTISPDSKTLESNHFKDDPMLNTGVSPTLVPHVINANPPLPTESEVVPDLSICSVDHVKNEFNEYMPLSKRPRSATDQTDLTDTSSNSGINAGMAYRSAGGTSALVPLSGTDTKPPLPSTVVPSTIISVTSKDSKEKEMTDKMRLGKVRPAYQGRSRSDSLGATDCEVATPEHSAL